MKMSFAQNIKTTVNEETLASLKEALLEEFKKVSASTKETNDNIEVSTINASFGSILRKDVSMITISNNRKNDGYVINCETEYKPSVAFWIFCVIDIILLTTVVGFVIGFGATLGLYFYNKSLVEKAIKDAFDKVKQNYD